MSMEERGKLTEVVKQLIELLGSIEEETTLENSGYIELRKKNLDLLKHGTIIIAHSDTLRIGGPNGASTSHIR
ncbi:MAG: hypothetical protein ACE5KA_04330 [Nitrososphaerales archaeon]